MRPARFLVIAAALALPLQAMAQEPYCMPCQAERWASIEKILLARAQRLKSARVLLRDAQQRGDADLIGKAQAHLDNATRQWEEIYRSAEALGSPSYKAHLAKNLVEAETSYDAAHADWKRKVEQFDRLRRAIGEQRERILRDIEGTLEEESNQRWRLGFNGVFSSMKAGAVYAEHYVRYVGSLPNGPAEHAGTIQALNRLIGAQRAAEAGKAGYEARGGRYWEAGAEAAQLALHVLVQVPPRLHPASVAAGPIASLSLDFAAVGLSHVEWREAQERLEDVRSTETRWQFDVAALAARAENLKRERELAADAIERQRAFEAQLRRVRAGMAP